MQQEKLPNSKKLDLQDKIHNHTRNILQETQNGAQTARTQTVPLQT